MDCNETRQYWNLYHDSEGDARLHFEIEEHLGGCPGCAEWFARQSRLEALLTEKLRDGTPTPALWNRVLVQAGLKQSTKVKSWLWMASVAACAAAILLTVLLLRPFGARSTDGNDLAHLSANWHERISTGVQPVAFESQSDEEVEDYLRGRVPFPVRCPPRKDAGFAVQGAGVCQLADQPAAYLSGHVDATPISIFVLPSESLDRFARQRDAVRRGDTHRCREGRYQMVMAVIDRNAVLVIGQTEPERLDRVLRAYGTYHH